MTSKIVNEYDQEIPQSQTADKRTNLIENMPVDLLSQVLTRYCLIYFGSYSKIGICF